VKPFFIILAFLAFPAGAGAQNGARLLVGVDTGSSFGNLFASIAVKLELPITRNFELDLRDNFAPIEQHLQYGDGIANQAEGGGIVWLSRSVGLNGQLERSQYHVSKLSKMADYGSAGVTFRRAVSSMPMRFSFDYERELGAGISQGIESSRLQAGAFDLDMRVACHGMACFRVEFNFEVGHVLQQGNPVCDGTFGITGGPGNGPCPRAGAISGAFTGAVMAEWPRRRSVEQLAF